ncbi:MAG: hypothetical protein HY906_06250 [Deltaproteobacteria bacterium]|nr:hypothetical protein [Deltaproteobacteria bacterium]
MDATEALLAALERLAGRLEETRHEMQARQAQLRTVRAEQAELDQELQRNRAAHGELERWLTASGALRARLLSQRDLYATALHETEQRLAKRRTALATLEREVRDQTAELTASREALRQLESMTNRLRTRFERRRLAR